MMQKGKLKMDEIIRAINHALDMGRNRLQWYSITKDEDLMKECKEWNDIASMYMNQLIKEVTNEKTVEI
jgi:hypothetical protein